MNLTKLGNIIRVTSGGTPSRKNPSYYENGTIPWVKTGDLKNKFIVNTEESITEAALQASSAKLFPPNTILLAMYGATIGACSILNFEAASNQACAALLPTEEVDSDYLFYFLHSIRNELISKGVGGAQPNISATIVKNLQIPLPPLPVQQKIAAILDAADLHRQKTKTLIVKYDQLTQSLFLEMFGDPVRNEKGWEIVRLPEMVKSERHSIKRGPFGGALKKEIFVESGYLVYEQQHAIYSDFSRGRYFIDKNKYKELSGFKVKTGDLIISCSGTIGKIAEIPFDAQEGIINQALLKISLNSEIINNQFFIFHFSHKKFQDVLFGVSRGTGITNFPPMGVIKDIPFIIPPIKLQNEFADSVKIASSQKKLALKALAKSEDLFNSLLQRAFKGELVN